MPQGDAQEIAARAAWRTGSLGLAVLAALVAASFFAYIALQRPGPDTLWGDEGTYVAMAASLARDGDLRFEEADREWAVARVPGRGVTVILQRAADGITYSKPPLYPLLAALPFKLFGESGLLLVNLLSLLAGLFCGWLYLRRIGDFAGAWLTTVTFTAAGVVVPYLAWRMSESLQVGLTLAGAALLCGALRPRQAQAGRWSRLLDHPTAPFAGGFLLGLLTTMRLTNAVLAGAALLALILARRWRSLAQATVGVLAGLALLLGLSQLMLGTASPYTAQRTSFNADLGYPLDDSLAASRFDERPASHRLGLRATKATLYSALYFVVGRHTGLLAYFPLALVLLGVIVHSRDPTGLALAAGAMVLSLFYLLYTPNNYFGGSTFLGNRYFLVAYPALLVALPRLPSARSLALVLAVGLAFGGSAMVSARQARGLTSSSQSHAAAGAFRWLPYESTAVGIQGHESRFWSGDYVRLVDPWADARSSHVVLHADRPAAELMVASHRPRETMLLIARPHAGAKQLLWVDWRSKGSVEVLAGPGQPPMRLSIEPSTPWRRHGLWFPDEQTYGVWTLRLRLEGPPASKLDVHYAGSDDRVNSGYQRRLVSAEIPATAVAGESGVIRVRIRNDSRRPWRQGDALPVTIGYRLEAADGLAAEGRQRFPGDVLPGDEIDVGIEVRWPAEPGDYRLILDLWLHPLHWFADLVGEPLADSSIRLAESSAARQR